MGGALVGWWVGRGSNWETQWVIGGALVGWWGAGVIGMHSGRCGERGRDGWGVKEKIVLFLLSECI